MNTRQSAQRRQLWIFAATLTVLVLIAVWMAIIFGNKTPALDDRPGPLVTPTATTSHR